MDMIVAMLLYTSINILGQLMAGIVFLMAISKGTKWQFFNNGQFEWILADNSYISYWSRHFLVGNQQFDHCHVINTEK